MLMTLGMEECSIKTAWGERIKDFLSPPPLKISSFGLPTLWPSTIKSKTYPVPYHTLPEESFQLLWIPKVEASTVAGAISHTELQPLRETEEP